LTVDEIDAISTPVNTDASWISIREYGAVVDTVFYSRSVHIGGASVENCVGREHQIARNGWLKYRLRRVGCNGTGWG
jgi:hypothetical protein